MLKASELMIGNYVLYNYPDGEWGEHQIQAEDFEDIENGDFKPIPIAEGWLLRLGFTFWNDSRNMLNIRAGEGVTRLDVDYDLKNRIMCYKGRFEIDEHTKPLPHIKYVHQLQNLYFALAGEVL